MKPEYRDAIQAVDLEEQPLAVLAGRVGITSNNAWKLRRYINAYSANAKPIRWK